MRAALLFVLVPAIALADASTPSKTTAAGASAVTPTTIEYTFSEPGGHTATQFERGMTVYSAIDGQPLQIVKRMSQLQYDVLDEGTPRNVGVEEVTPFAFDVDGHRVTVAFQGDFTIAVRVVNGKVLELTPAGQGFLSRKGGNVSAELVDGVAPVTLIKVSSRPEACSDYWDIYVSVVDGVPRQALALYSVADPPAMQTSTVKLGRDGTAVVTVRTEEDEKHVRTARTRYRFDGRVYVAVPKRAATRSK